MRITAKIIFTGFLSLFTAAIVTAQAQSDSTSQQQVNRQASPIPQQAQQQAPAQRQLRQTVDATENTAAGKPVPEGVKVQRLDISKAICFEPRSFKNLQIVFIKGGAGADVDYVSLAEAIEKKLVKVEETGNVQSLTIENTSSKERIFVQAGDIVKGGRQDRTLQTDMILPPNSGKLPLPSFCVEHSRWSKRGEEKDDTFGANNSVLASRAQKGAAYQSKSQGAVWDSVSTLQTKLNENVSKISGKDIDVRSSKSASSLELTMDNPDLKKIIGEYQKGIGELPTDATGYLYAINGELCGGDLYFSSRLLGAEWPKLSKSIIVESISEYGRFEKGMTLLPDGSTKVLVQFAELTPKDSLIEPVTIISQFCRESVFRMDSYDMPGKQQALWVHTSILDAPQEVAEGYRIPMGLNRSTAAEGNDIIRNNSNITPFSGRMNAAPPSHFPNDPVWNVVIEHIEFEDVTIKTVLDDIQNKALAKLPAGTKMELKFISGVPVADRPANDLTITMVVDDIPLREALHYVARAANLKYQIDGTTVTFSTQANGD